MIMIDERRGPLQAEALKKKTTNSLLYKLCSCDCQSRKCFAFDFCECDWNCECAFEASSEL